jgi:Tol biopolymer transport system component
MRLQIVTPPSLDPLHFALSPDGRHIAYVVSGASSEAPQRLYLRALDKSDAQPLAGTDGALFPFWSPDSRSVGFFASGKLLRIDIAGGPAQVLAPAVNPLGGAWSDDGTILYSPNTVSPLFRVPATGGAPVAATELDSPRQSYHRRPSFLPHGRQFLFFAMGEPAVAGIYLGSLDGGKPKRLTAADSPGVYLAPGRVVFLQDGNLVARQFNAERKELVGDPVTLADKVGASDSVAEFSISSSGIVAYRKGRGAPGQQTWFDRTGKVLGQLGSQNAADLSPDGRFVAYDRFTGSNRDVWILDLDRGGNTPFTHHPNVDGFPVWSKDGSRIAFESQRKGNFDLMVKLFTGVADSEQFLLETPDNEWPLNWSMDDRFLLYQKSDQNFGATDLLALPMTGDIRTPIVIANAVRGAYGRFFTGRPLGHLRNRRVWPARDRRAVVSRAARHPAYVHNRWQRAAMEHRRKGDFLYSPRRKDDGRPCRAGRDVHPGNTEAAVSHSYREPEVQVSICRLTQRTLPDQ